jgi:hypothetical protein
MGCRKQLRGHCPLNMGRLAWICTLRRSYVTYPVGGILPGLLAGELTCNLHSLRQPFRKIRCQRCVHVQGFALKNSWCWHPICTVICLKTRVLAESKSRGSAVGIVTGYRLDDRGIEVLVPVGSRIFAPPHRPDQLWCPPSLLSNGYGRLFPRG